MRGRSVCECVCLERSVFDRRTGEKRKKREIEAPRCGIFLVCAGEERQKSVNGSDWPWEFGGLEFEDGDKKGTFEMRQSVRVS